MKGKTRIILWGIIGVMLIASIWLYVSGKSADKAIQSNGNQTQIVQQIEPVN